MNIDQHYIPDIEIEKNVYPTPLKVFGETVGKIMGFTFVLSGCLVGLLLIATLIVRYFPVVIILLNK